MSNLTQPIPRTIAAICHDWRVSLARFELECTEAQDDEDANGSAIEREAERANSLLDDMEAAEISSCSDAEDLLYIVLKLMKDGHTTMIKSW